MEAEDADIGAARPPQGLTAGLSVELPDPPHMGHTAYKKDALMTLRKPLQPKSHPLLAAEVIAAWRRSRRGPAEFMIIVGQADALDGIRIR